MSLNLKPAGAEEGLKAVEARLGALSRKASVLRDGSSLTLSISSGQTVK